MSLLNQVLRDLDRRHAPAPAPSVKTTAPPRPRAASGGQRVMRWGLGVIATAAAVVVGGMAQGSLRWPGQAGPGVEVAVAAPMPLTPPPVAPQPVAPPPVAPQPVAPVVVAAAPMVTPASAAAVMTPPVALAAPAPIASVRPAAPAPRRVAIAPPTPRPAPALEPASPAPKAEAPTPRIDVRASTRTAHDRAEAHYQRGVTAHQSGLFNDSAAAFTAALREDPRHVPARVAQAGVLVALTRPDDAQSLLKEGLALVPGQPQLALMLARLQADRDDWGAATETLRSAMAQAGGDAEFHGFHAAILQRAGHHAAAAEAYGSALKLAPGKSVWWMGLAISLEALGQIDSARTAFQRARAMGLPEAAAGYVDARLRQLG